MPDRSIKPNVFITISGTMGSGKSMVHRTLQVWMEKNAGYSVTHISGNDQEDPTIVFEDPFHRIILQTQQTDGKEASNA